MGHLFMSMCGASSPAGGSRIQGKENEAHPKTTLAGEEQGKRDVSKARGRARGRPPTMAGSTGSRSSLPHVRWRHSGIFHLRHGLQAARLPERPSFAL